MTSITITINLKPETRNMQVMNVPTEKEVHGPGSVECKCGQRFVAFQTDNSKEFGMFTALIRQDAQRQMTSAGLLHPLAGSLRMVCRISVECPECHVIGGDLPATGKAPSKIMDAIEGALKGVVFKTAGQVADCRTMKAYRKSNVVEIEVSQIRAHDLDSECRQMELF